MAKKAALTAAKDEFSDLRKRFSLAADRWSQDRKRYKEDTHFLYVDHWPQEVRADRQSQTDPRLCLEIDQLSQYVRQVINDSRQNRPQIKVRPVDSGADIETARVYDGLCRHWQEASNADTCYDVALECACAGGFGYFRILHDYLHDATFDQDFRFSPINNPLTVYYGDHKEPDGSDAKECWIVEEIPKEDYEAEYPGFKTTSWEGEGSKYGDWGGEKIRVAELYEIRMEPRNLHLLSDGSVATDEEIAIAKENGDAIAPIVETRNIPKKCLWWSKFNGAEYLEQPRMEPGDRIPVFPVWGNLQNVDGKVRHTSMIHKSKDAQLLYDYAQTAFAERVGQSPEAPWVAAAGQVENHLDNWDGSRRARVQLYDPVDINGNAIPPPQRQSPSDIPTGFAQTMQQAEHGVQTSLGMYSASVGRKGNATSGVQEQEQARKGDVSSFHYHDNLSRAIRSAGRYLISAAPEIIDSARVVRILGIDGVPQNVQLDPTQQQASMQQGVKNIFNIGVGTYDVAVDVGPSYQTSRQASAAGMLALAQADPTMWQTHGDLIAEAQDWPEAQRFAQRSKLLLPPQVQEAEQSGDSPEVQQIKAQAGQKIQQQDQMLQEAQQQLQEMGTKLQQLENQKGAKDGELQIKAAELHIRGKELEIEQFDAETRRIAAIAQADAAAATSQQNAINAINQAEASQPSPSVPNAPPSPTIQINPGEVIGGHLDHMTQSSQSMSDSAQALLSAAADIRHVMTAPKVKRAKATRQPDGSFTMESVETPQ